MPTEALLASSEVVVRGTVLETEARWNAERTVIYTTVRVAVQTVIKAAGVPRLLELQLPGGEVDGLGMVVSHTPVLHAGDDVVLFLTEEADGARMTGRRLVPRGGEHGVQHIVNGIVEREQLRVDDYQALLQRFMSRPEGEWEQIRAAFRARRVASSAKTTATIASFSPTSGSGGTGTIVTVTGTGFGATQGSGTVRFTKVQGSTWVTALVLTWSDTEIKCLVPDGASSGPLRVTPDGGSAVTSGSDFDLSYASGSRKWPGSNPTVTYYINANTSDISGVGEGTALDDAIATWNAAGANFTFANGGSIGSTTASANGINEIFWGSSSIDGEGGTLARNTNWYYPDDGTIVESDIEFDDDETWSLCDPSCPGGSIDVETVALHELGHTLNLYDTYHSNDAPSGGTPKVMYGYTTVASTQRSLFSSDVTGAKAIYGPASGGASLAGGGVYASVADRAIYATPDASPLDLGAADFTLEAWIRPTATPPSLPIDYVVLAAKSDFVGDRSYELVLTSNRTVSFRVSTDGSNSYARTTEAVVPLNTWTHVRAVFLRSGTSIYLRIYIDGVLDLETSSSYNTGVTTLHDSSVDFVIGGVDYGGTDQAAGEFVGDIDEVRLATTDRQHSTFESHALPSAFEPDANDVGFWKFNSTGANPSQAAKTASGGDALMDVSGSGNYDLEITVLSGALPVELVAFDARVDAGSVLLTWATASETNNAGFFVEHRGAQGEETAWQVLGFVEGHGTTLEAQQYAYSVDALLPGRHRFRIKQIDFDGTFEYHPEVEVLVEVAGTYMLSNAYPNPFNPTTTFDLAVAREQPVRVEVFDALGRRVRLLHDGPLPAQQSRRIVFDADGLPGGLYVVRAVGETFRADRSVMLVK